jgi:uncharacterized protein
MGLERDDASIHPHALLARRAWQAVSRGDREELAALVASDVVWHATAPHPWFGDHPGLEGAFDFLAQLGAAVEVFDATLLDVLASDERALVLFHVSAQRGGARLETDYVMIARVSGGRIVEIWTAALNARAVEAFWSDALAH